MKRAKKNYGKHSLDYKKSLYVYNTMAKQIESTYGKGFSYIWALKEKIDVIFSSERRRKSVEMLPVTVPQVPNRPAPFLEG